MTFLFNPHKKLLFLIILVLGFGFTSFSQNEKKHDSIPSPNYKRVSVTTLADFTKNEPNWIEQDTSMNLFSEYDAVLNQTFAYSTLGNLGSSHRMLDYESNPFGFRFKDVPLSQYLITKNNINIYKPTSPYTRIYYITGSGKLQHLGGNHAQKIKNLTIGINFGIINSLGIYQHQKTNLSGASVYTNYKTANNRYEATLVYYFNKINLQENGGLANDSLFDNNVETYRAGMPVNIEKAQNKIVDNNLFFTHYYNFSKSNDTINNFFNWGSIVHTVDFSKGKWIYSEEEIDSTTANIFYRDSLNTLDSLGYLLISNNLEWRNNFCFNKKTRKLYANMGINHQFINVGDYKLSHTYQNILLNASLYFTWDSIINARYKMNYMLSGYGKNGYEQTLNFSYKIKSNNSLNFEFLNRINPPSYFVNNYHSNYYEWQNYFKPTHETKIGLIFSTKFSEIGIEALNVKNYIYFSKNFVPTLYDENINIYRTWASINLKWKVLNSQTKLTYHKNNADSILMFPEYTIRERLFFIFPMFHNAMIANAGFDLYYIPKFKSTYYSPSLFNFYVKNDKEIGNYVYVDLFAGFKVKRFNFFVKLINAPKGLLPYNYYTTPNYPLPDRQFRIGFSWRFYD